MGGGHEKNLEIEDLLTVGARDIKGKIVEFFEFQRRYQISLQLWQLALYLLDRVAAHAC
jgi:hypothetical protein